MSATFLKNGNKVHLYMNTICKRHTVPNSIYTPITRSQVQHSKASYSRFVQTNARQMEFSIPFSGTNAKGVSNFSSVSNGRVIGWYMDMLKTRPILTTSISTAFLYTVSDLSSQIITGSSSESYDIIRTFRMAGYGMIVAGPSLHFWFKLVSRLLPKRDLIATIKKIFMGLGIFAPVMTAVFFSLNACLQGESGSEIVARLKRDMIPALTNGVMYWSLCDFITFRFIPVPLQPLLTNSFAYIWTVYMTYMASLEKSSHQVIENM